MVQLYKNNLDGVKDFIVKACYYEPRIARLMCQGIHLGFRFMVADCNCVLDIGKDIIWDIPETRKGNMVQDIEMKELNGIYISEQECADNVLAIEADSVTEINIVQILKIIVFGRSRANISSSIRGMYIKKGKGIYGTEYEYECISGSMSYITGYYNYLESCLKYSFINIIPTGYINSKAEFDAISEFIYTGNGTQAVKQQFENIGSKYARGNLKLKRVKVSDTLLECLKRGEELVKIMQKREKKKEKVRKEQAVEDLRQQLIYCNNSVMIGSDDSKLYKIKPDESWTYGNKIYTVLVDENDKNVLRLSSADIKYLESKYCSGAKNNIANIINNPIVKVNIDDIYIFKNKFYFCRDLIFGLNYSCRGVIDLLWETLAERGSQYEDICTVFHEIGALYYNVRSDVFYACADKKCISFNLNQRGVIQNDDFVSEVNKAYREARETERQKKKLDENIGINTPLAEDILTRAVLKPYKGHKNDILIWAK